MTSLETTLSQTGLTAVRLRFLLVRLGRTLRRDGTLTLSSSQISALATIEECGPMRISTMATRDAIDPSVATRVLASLDRQGLVKRMVDPEDKRASLIDLSAKGRHVLTALWNERTLTLTARLEQLNAKERRAIEAALPALEKLTRDH